VLREACRCITRDGDSRGSATARTGCVPKYNLGTRSGGAEIRIKIKSRRKGGEFLLAVAR
jgi:hypothetical protein